MMRTIERLECDECGEPVPHGGHVHAPATRPSPATLRRYMPEYSTLRVRVAAMAMCQAWEDWLAGTGDARRVEDAAGDMRSALHATMPRPRPGGPEEA